MNIRLSQQITVWKASQDNFGKPTFTMPEAIAGFWTAKQEKFYNEEGVEQVSKAICVLAKDVAPGDYMAPGDYGTDKDPTKVSEAVRVRGFNKFPDLSANTFLRKAYG